MTLRKTPSRRLASVAVAKSKRTASEPETLILIDGTREASEPNASAARRKPRSRSTCITSEGHTRKIFGPALEGKRHLTDEVIAAIAEKISSK